MRYELSYLALSWPRSQPLRACVPSPEDIISSPQNSFGEILHRSKPANSRSTYSATPSETIPIVGRNQTLSATYLIQNCAVLHPHAGSAVSQNSAITTTPAAPTTAGHIPTKLRPNDPRRSLANKPSPADTCSTPSPEDIFLVMSQAWPMNSLRPARPPPTSARRMILYVSGPEPLWTTPRRRHQAATPVPPPSRGNFSLPLSPTWPRNFLRAAPPPPLPHLPSSRTILDVRGPQRPLTLEEHRLAGASTRRSSLSSYVPRLPAPPPRA